MRRINWAWYPPVGVFIALLALISVVVPFFRDLGTIGQREKALWTMIFFLLVWLEIRSIYLDRAKHDRMETSARNRSDEIMQGVQDSINSITGGDSYAYVVFSCLERACASIWVTHGGKYPLHGETARITDVNKLNEMSENKIPFTLNNLPNIYLTVGDISANTTRLMGQITFSGADRQDYNIFFNGRNGFWTELMRMRWIDNKWASAVRVLGADGQTVLFEKIDPAFPRTNQEADWSQDTRASIPQ